MTANAIELAHYIRATYPEVPVIGGVRPDRLPDHPSGHALDIMVYGNRSLGDRIANDLRAHTETHHVKYVLWWVTDHFDHVHVTVR